MTHRPRSLPNEGRWPSVGQEDFFSGRRGEFFDITIGRDKSYDLRALDVQPRLRHLALMLERYGELHKYLCGHDERSWFSV